MPRPNRVLAVITACAIGATGLIAAPLAATAAEPGIRINEVESNGGVPGDWVEFFNETAVEIDLSGYTFRDNDDNRTPYTLPAGSVVAPGGYLVLDEFQSTTGEGDFDFGLGGGDSARLFDPSGTLVTSTSWTAHAATTWGFTPAGTWELTLASTKGAVNSFPVPEVPGTGEIVINEIDSSPSDWAEFFNPGDADLDVSGYEVRDNSDDHRWFFPAGSVITAGGFLVVDAKSAGLNASGAATTFEAEIGIGSADEIRLFDPAGTLIDRTQPWNGHASLDGSEASATLARCPDGEGPFVLAHPTQGAANSCVVPESAVRINEVESDGGSPDDWVELVNPTAAVLDVSGILVRDNSADIADAYTIPAGTTIPANGYLVIERADLGFGLGGADEVRLFDGAQLIDSTSWTSHAAVTWGRCPDTTGSFGVTESATKGAANVCAGEIEVQAWPGSAEVRVLDSAPMFLEDSSGLDVQQTEDGTFLWAVDNGTGTFWKLEASADGSVEFVPGWEDGKRARYQRDAANPAAAGPDSEGITVGDDGYVYLAVERDNSAKAVNENYLLKIDPDASGPDIVATQEWDLTALLPAVEANTGVEAVEWVADSVLDGALWDTAKNKAYDPADYPTHGEGLFFVAFEENGGVYAFALTADGDATLVSEIDPGLSGVMGLDYDSALDVLWAVCDDGCEGTSAQVEFNGTDAPGLAHFARPAGMPNLNNEGFATAPASLSVNGQRPVWWFADGYTSEALRVGTLPGGVDGGTGGEPGGPGDGGSGGDGDSGAPSDPPVEALPGDDLVDDNAGSVSAPGSVVAGGTVTISVGAAHAGTDVEVWLYSTPSRIASGVLDAQGRITVTIPASTTAGTHRIAVYDQEGTLLGWTSIQVTAASGSGSLPATGGDGGAGIAAVWAVALLLVGAGATVIARRRTRSA